MPGQYLFQVTATGFLDQSISLISDVFYQKLTVLPAGSSSDSPLPPELRNAIQISTLYLRCQANKTVNYTSHEFDSLIADFNGNYSLVNPKKLPFIFLNKLELVVKPTPTTLNGYYKVYLVAFDP